MKKEDIRFMNKKLNLGCGNDIREEFINIDFERFSGVDMVYDLNKMPYPFKDSYFEEILMQDILEHLEDPYSIMKEIWRISKKNAIVKIRVPHFSSNNVWSDIQHKRGYSSETFKNKNLKKFFTIRKQKITFGRLKHSFEKLFNKLPVFYERHLAYIFPAVNLEIDLIVKK